MTAAQQRLEMYKTIDKSTRRPLAQLLLGLALLPLAANAGGAADPHQQLLAMDFLAGNWSGQMWGGELVAHYTTPEGGMVLSYTELRRDGEVAFHEFERFDVEDGRVVFTPYPGGKRAVQMWLTELDQQARKAVFENPDKDFPTRIIYQRIGEDQLLITLSDPHHDSDQVQNFEFRRQRAD